MRRFLPMLLFVLLALALVADAQELPPGKGKEIVQQQCATCHALKVVTAKRATKEQWATLVDQMISRGAQIEDDDIDTVVDYLAKNFGPSSPPPADAPKGQAASHTVHVNTASSAELAAGLEVSAKEADAMVAYREANGKFKDWHELAKVPGVDAGKIESKKNCLAF